MDIPVDSWLTLDQQLVRTRRVLTDSYALIDELPVSLSLSIKMLMECWSRVNLGVDKVLIEYLLSVHQGSVGAPLKWDMGDLCLGVFISEKGW